MTSANTRVEKKYAMSVPGSPEVVFPLLCPVREYEWLPYWKGKMVYSISGKAERGCVFTTEFPGKGQAIWMITRYDPPETITFAVFLPHSHIWTLNISAKTSRIGECDLIWQHTFTAVNPEGKAFLDQYDDEKHRILMSRIERCLIHFLRTGQMLKEG